MKKILFAMPMIRQGTENRFTYDRQGGIVEEKNPTAVRLFSYNSHHQQTKVETESGYVQENRYDVEDLRFELLENFYYQLDEQLSTALITDRWVLFKTVTSMMHLACGLR